MKIKITHNSTAGEIDCRVITVGGDDDEDAMITNALDSMVTVNIFAVGDTITIREVEAPEADRDRG